MNEIAIRRVLVPVKPHPRGLPAAAGHGRVLAERFGAELTLMSTVYDSTVAMRLARGRAGADEARRGMLDAERVALERVAASLRDWGVSVETEVRWHHPAYEAVVDVVRARRADLVAVDVLDPHPILHSRLTDWDWQLMRSSPCPVLYVNDPGFPSYETIVAAVDPLHAGPRTDATDRAVLGAAKAFARAFGSKLRVVHAYPDPAGYSWISSVQVRPGVFFDVESLEAAHRRAVEALVEECGIGADAIDLCAGSPPDAILDSAARRGAKLIVLGALERGELRQALLGSTAEAVAAAADCDVLLVKAR